MNKPSELRAIIDYNTVVENIEKERLQHSLAMKAIAKTLPNLERILRHLRCKNDPEALYLTNIIAEIRDHTNEN